MSHTAFRVPFVGGPYDGADFTFAERLPDRIEFGVNCLNADMNDPDVQEAIDENLSPPELHALVVTRRAPSIVQSYQLDKDREQVPFYRWTGSKEGGDNLSSGVDNGCP